MSLLLLLAWSIRRFGITRWSPSANIGIHFDNLAVALFDLHMTSPVFAQGAAMNGML
jgi:hypothetical protein